MSISKHTYGRSQVSRLMNKTIQKIGKFLMIAGAFSSAISLILTIILTEFVNRVFIKGIAVSFVILMIGVIGYGIWKLSYMEEEH